MDKLDDTMDTKKTLIFLVVMEKINPNFDVYCVINGWHSFLL